MFHDLLGGEWDEAKSMGNEFIMKNRRIRLQLNPINGHRWRLSDHHSTYTIRHTELQNGIDKFSHSIVIETDNYEQSMKLFH